MFRYPARIQLVFREYTHLPAAVHILCAGSFVNRAGSFVMLFLSIYVSEQLKLGPAFAGYCIGAIGLGSVCSALLGGHLADHFGRRATMLLAMFGGAFMLVVLSFVRSAPLFLAVAFVTALVMELYRPAVSAMISDVTAPEQRAQAFGLMYVMVNLGFAIAPPVGGFLAGYSFQWLFWGDALTTALGGLVILWFIRESHPGMSPDTIVTRTPDAKVARTPELPISAAAKHIACDTTFLLFCLCNLITSMVFMQAIFTLPVYLSSRGYTPQDFGRVICVNGLLIVLFQFAVTHATKRFHRITVLIVGDLLIGLGISLTAFAGSAQLLIGTIAIWTLGEMLQAPHKPALVADLAPVELRARYMGVLGLSWALSQAIGAPIGGYVLARFGPNVLWPGCLLMTVLSCGLYCLLWQRLSRATAQQLAVP